MGFAMAEFVILEILLVLITITTLTGVAMVTIAILAPTVRDIIQCVMTVMGVTVMSNVLVEIVKMVFVNQIYLRVLITTTQAGVVTVIAILAPTVREIM